MRFAMIILLALVAAPLPAQQVIDRFPAGSRSELTPLQIAPERPSPVTVGKVVGALGGTLAGAYAGGGAALVLSGGKFYPAILGTMVGAAAGATLGAYIPGESPPHTVPATLAMAAMGSVAAGVLVFIFPPLAPAGPAAGALIGFSMAY